MRGRIEDEQASERDISSLSTGTRKKEDRDERAKERIPWETDPDGEK